MRLAAMSCFQGRTQDAAWQALAALPIEGVQLTPGNLPSPGFQARVEASVAGSVAGSVVGSGWAVRFHHSFAWAAYRREVWRGGRLARALSPGWSVHPPTEDIGPWREDAAAAGLVLEAMYPGVCLGTGDALEAYLETGLPLAVDISHLHIQRTQGALSAAVLARILDAPQVVEIHLSHNDGQRDAHAPLTPQTPLLGWAQARERAGVPVVYESYLHRLSRDDTLRQMALAWGEG